MSPTSPVLTFAIRGTQALFAMVVFGLSSSLIRGHHLGSVPSTLGFVAFVGGVSVVGALLGVAAHWVRVLQGQVGVLVDAVVVGINVAGGIVGCPSPCYLPATRLCVSLLLLFLLCFCSV